MVTFDSRETADLFRQHVISAVTKPYEQATPSTTHKTELTSVRTAAGNTVLLHADSAADVRMTVIGAGKVIESQLTASEATNLAYALLNAAVPERWSPFGTAPSWG